MVQQVGLGVLHLLLGHKPKHISHQQQTFTLSPVASGCTIDCNSLTPGTDVLPWHKRHRWDLVLIEDHWDVKLILHQVNFLQDLPLAKVTQRDWTFHL